MAFVGLSNKAQVVVVGWGSPVQVDDVRTQLR